MPRRQQHDYIGHIGGQQVAVELDIDNAGRPWWTISPRTPMPDCPHCGQDPRTDDGQPLVQSTPTDRTYIECWSCGATLTDLILDEVVLCAHCEVDTPAIWWTEHGASEDPCCQACRDRLYVECPSCHDLVIAEDMVAVTTARETRWQPADGMDVCPRCAPDAEAYDEG